MGIPGVFRSLRLLLWLPLAAGWSPFALGWGAGHDALNELATKAMPPALREALPEAARNAVVRHSHAPDDFTPWEKQSKVTVHPDDLAFLHAHGLNHPYSLHSPKGQAANFLLLVTAFRAQAPDRIAYWSACLLHTMADEAACNHDPLLHFLTYAFGGGYGLPLAKTGVLDFAQVARTAADRQIVEEMLAGFAPGLLDEDPERALVAVMLHGLRANEYMTQRGRRIARTFAADASAEEIRIGRAALAELGVHGIRSGLDAIWTARQFAAKGLHPEWTPAVEAEYQKQARAYGARRPLASDSIFDEVLAPFGDGPYVGVLVEPSQSMNRGVLPFSAKYLGAATLRALREAGLACRPLDVRSVEGGGLPGPDEMAAVVVCSGGLGRKSIADGLRAYGGAGGRILLVGGEHGGLLGDLSACLAKPADARFPVSPRYGQNNADYIGALRVRFVGDLAEQTGGEPLAFVHNPDTKAGWQKPRCDYALVGARPNVRVLARLLDGERVLDIAGVLVDGQGATRFAFVPEYLVSPYLLTDSPPLVDPSRPVLDAIGRRVLLHIVRGMLP